jgi:hypothetical protein
MARCATLDRFLLPARPAAQIIAAAMRIASRGYVDRRVRGDRLALEVGLVIGRDGRLARSSGRLHRRAAQYTPKVHAPPWLSSVRNSA